MVQNEAQNVEYGEDVEWDDQGNLITTETTGEDTGNGTNSLDKIIEKSKDLPVNSFNPSDKNKKTKKGGDGPFSRGIFKGEGLFGLKKGYTPLRSAFGGEGLFGLGKGFTPFKNLSSGKKGIFGKEGGFLSDFDTGEGWFADKMPGMFGSMGQARKLLAAQIAGDEPADIQSIIKNVGTGLAKDEIGDALTGLLGSFGGGPLGQNPYAGAQQGAPSYDFEDVTGEDFEDDYDPTSQGLSGFYSGMMNQGKGY